VFQFAGGRILGPERFAPVSVLWTLMFLTGTVALTPVEQYVARESTAGRRVVSTLPWAIAAVVLLTATLAGSFAWLTRDALFDGANWFVALSVLVVATTAPLFIARGLVIGARRFDLYGLMLGLEGLGRLVLGALGLLVIGGPVGVAWGIALGPALGLIVPTLRFERQAHEPASGQAASFLAPYIGASGASQLLLAGAPLAVAALGADAATISVVFVTFTLLRAPVTIVYLVQGRMLNLLVRLGIARDTIRIGRIRRRIEFGGLTAVALAGTVGWLAGPDAVSLLYGAAFRPDPLVAALAATGVAAAGTAQLLGQLLVAEGRTAVLARRWTVGLAAALLMLLAAPVLLGTEPAVTVAMAFVAGELTAAVAMTRRTAASEPDPAMTRD
jgi:O-antigen/teichoic acid export membrane protein